MEIRFCLAWLQSGVLSSKAFKLEAARTLFSEYVTRISKFTPCQIAGMPAKGGSRKTARKIWVCDRSQGAKMLSSEALADTLEKVRDSGTRELCITIGGPDGFSAGELEALKPDLRWSFGPLTLPHELAAVVATEQIYRAWSIIKHLPYHTGH
ncbi:MAG: 23S rRNA (pseudouridine(1915)-N(3))-methyltransferase RlmH [Candidatus Omnitrophica bacterium]|nr:23S rRNA (pseudouridine(1915)-N(3))-methyltransferase RlmH [Candidatus Omnitrophota bacterium]